MNRDVCEHFNPVDLPCDKCKGGHMTTLREAAQQALEAMDKATRYMSDADYRKLNESIEELRAALAEPVVNQQLTTEPVQEPVALDWLHKWANQDDGEPETQWHEGYEAARRVVQIHLTAPPQRKPLTEEEIWRTYKNLWMFHPAEEPRLAGDVLKFARAVERAHGIV